MIKIVRGVYGYVDKDGIVRPKTEADDPFELLPEQEARLVSLGVAKYVVSAVSEQEPADAVEEEIEGEEPIDFDEMPTEVIPLSELSVKELRDLGKEYGLSFKVGTTKAEMIQAIEDAEAALNTDAEDEDGEPVPVFDASEAVQ